MNITKKIVAIVTSLTVFAFVAAPFMNVAQGATVDDLQAQIAALLAQLNSLQSQLTTLQGGGTTGGTGACTGITFTRPLSQGVSGNDVKCLQTILNQSADTRIAASGTGSSGNETVYFGSLTKAAVVKFQVKYASEILTPSGLTNGTGYVGNKTIAKLNAMVGGVVPPPPGAGENKVSLAADSPSAATIAKGAQNVIFAKINFCAASAANTVSQIVLQRTGVAQDTDISNVKLYEGVTQVGSTQAVNSTTHQATFSSLNWTIAANTCKVLTVKASISVAAQAGDTPKFSIATATGITSTVALDGIFPLASNSMTIAGISTGALDISTTTHNTTVVAGATEQAVSSFSFTASSTEGVKIYSVKVTEVGSSVDSDVSNIKLFYQSTQLGSTVASLTNSAATFDLSSSPLELLVGTSKTLTVYVDVGSGTGIQDRKIQFEITDNTGVTAYGTNSGGSVPIYGNAWSSSDTWSQKTTSVDIVLGSLTVTSDTTYTPAAQEYARGTTNNDMVAIKFLAGANEGVRITEFKLMRSHASLADTDVSNITLYDAETGARLTDTSGNTIGAGSMVSGYVDFGSHTTGFDSTGLFDIEKGKSKIVLVKADVSSGATVAASRLGFEIDNPTTQIWADGLSSKTDLKTTDINGAVPTSVPSTAVLHDIIEKGTLTVSVNSGTPSGQGYALGASGFTFAKFDLKATGEDILVSQLNVYFDTDTTAGATSTAAGTSDVNNVTLYVGDDTTPLKTDTTLSAGYAQFSVNLTIPKNGSKVLTVKADVPTASAATALTAWIQIASDISATGYSSNVTITPSASAWTTVRGNLMLKGAPILTIKSATTPATKTVVSGTAGALVATIYLTATNTEDLKVTRIQIAGDSTSTATSTASTPITCFSQPVTGLGGYNVRDYVGNIAIYDGSTGLQIGNTVSTMTHGTNYDYANFTGLSLTIPKGTTRAINVLLNVVQATTSTGNANAFYFGIATTTVASVDITAAGIQSGTAATYVIDAGGAAGQPMFFGTSGTLALTSAADMPIAAELIDSSTGNSFGKWKFTGGTEVIKVSKVAFDAHHSNASATTVLIPESGIWALATTGNVTRQSYAFNYSIGGAATATCWFNYANGTTTGHATSSDNFIAVFNSASSTCYATATPGILAYAATSSGYVGLYASTTGANKSLQLQDYPGPYAGGGDASNTLDTLKGGLRYGSTETIAKLTGNKANIAKLSLYADDVWVADGYLDAQTVGRVIFYLPTGSEILVPAAASKYITLKGDISNYLAAVSGSTIFFSIGTTTSDTDYITAQGASSGTTLTDTTITLNTELDGNEYWLYATKPTVTLNSSSPSGAQTVGANKEVMRFDVTNVNAGFDLTVNAIRFTISTNASSAAFDKTFKFYKSTDQNTVIGQAVSWASGTSSAVTGYATMYPWSGNVIAPGATVTYILKMDTSLMNSVSGTDQLTLSIEDGDFYFSDGISTTANQKVLNLPVTGNLLTY